MKRRILAVILATAMMVSGIAPAGDVQAKEVQTTEEQAEEQKEEVQEPEVQEEEVQKSVAAVPEGLKFEEQEDGTLSITGYAGEDTELVIPGKIDGKKQRVQVIKHFILVVN